MNMLRLVVGLLLLACVVHPLAAEEPDYSEELPRIAPTPPDRAIKTFQVQEGYKIEQVAAEPLVASPVAICWDEQGRMFVVEMRGYSEHRDDAVSRIRVLVDDDGDGVYDRSSVFADRLLWPTALFPWDGGLFVADAPDILYLKDTTGDGVADVRKRVFTGFGTSNVQGLLNSFHWHLDNRIHGTASSNGGEITLVESLSPDQKLEVKPAVSMRGRDFSFDPRTLDFRAESGGAQHGMSFDDFGRKFVCSNSDHAQQVMYEDRYVARNPLFAAPPARVSIASDGPQAEVFRTSPVEPWRIVRTRLRVSGEVPGIVEGGGRAAGYFTGATGVTSVRGSAFREDPLRGMLVVGDVGGNLVHRKQLTLRGVQYQADRVDQESEFISSSDTWFRPAQFANGPDGALYIIDVYREVIEHPHSIPPVIKKHLDLNSGRDCGRIYRLAPENWKRPSVPRLDKSSTLELVKLLDHDNAWQRETAARLLYERRDRAAVQPLIDLLIGERTSPLGRIHALYALKGFHVLREDLLLTAMDNDDPRVREHAVRLAEKLGAGSAKIAWKLTELAGDDDLQVRYQVAFTAGELNQQHRAAPLARLLRDAGSDRWLQAACLSSLGTGADEALITLLSDKEKDPNVAPLARLLAQQVARQGVEEIEHTLEALAGAPADHAALPVVMLAMARGLRSRDVKLSQESEDRIANVLNQAQRKAKETLLDANRSSDEKLAALDLVTLLPLAEVSEGFVGTLAPQSPRELQLAAVRTLGEFNDPLVGKLLVDAWGTFTPEARRAAGEVLISRPERTRQLLAAVSEEKIRASEIERGQVEVALKHADAAIREQAEKLFAGNANRADVIEQYREALTMKGSVERGRELFAKNCVGCHRLEGKGHELGPNLSAMRFRGAEAILLNVLDPNREVNPQYLSYVAVTTEGKTLTGMIAAESAASISLRRADGQGDEVLRTDLEELRSTGLSLMPEGLEREIDLQGMADLIAYLLSPK
jgi:putative membrane-bound dehydrogenase-like protein